MSHVFNPSSHDCRKKYKVPHPYLKSFKYKLNALLGARVYFDKVGDENGHAVWAVKKGFEDIVEMASEFVVCDEDSSSTASTPPLAQPPTLEWSALEVEAMKEGVKQFGTNWSKILSSYSCFDGVCLFVISSLQFNYCLLEWHRYLQDSC
jgi:hypothetical protein